MKDNFEAKRNQKNRKRIKNPSIRILVVNLMNMVCFPPKKFLFILLNVYNFLEPNVLHTVNTFIEMPEGAQLSDNEDKDKFDINDPHRALDINLDL